MVVVATVVVVVVVVVGGDVVKKIRGLRWANTNSTRLWALNRYVREAFLGLRILRTVTTTLSRTFIMLT